MPSVPTDFKLGNRDASYDQKQATMFMDWGEPGDRLVDVWDRTERVAGIWLEPDVVVTWIHPSSAVGFGFLDSTRDKTNLIWVNLDYDTPMPTAEEARFMASLKGIGR